MSENSAPTVAPRPWRRPATGMSPARTGRGGWLNWSSWPTRMRMIALVLAIDVLAALVSCAVIVVNARSAVEVEMQAAMTNVELLVSDTIDLARNGAPAGILQTLNLRIHDLRHVRVTVLDASGSIVPGGFGRVRRDQHVSPDWFARLIAPPIREHDLPIVAQGQRIGTARITTQPRDEIDEVWGYAVSLSLTSLGLSLGLLLALYVAFGRVLAPSPASRTG